MTVTPVSSCRRSIPADRNFAGVRVHAGPVTNHPLAVCDFSTLNVEQDILHMAGSYGTAYGVSSSGELCTASRG